MWTGKWWNAVQTVLPKGATLAPIIVSTNKTQLTQFSGSKSAYPVYLTIGNLPKSIQRRPSENSTVLLSYLSSDKINTSHLSKAEKKAKMQRLFHESMRTILEPLREASVKGVEMVCGDGKVRMVHPVLTSYIANYPEQCLVSCTKSGTCPKCDHPHKDLQNATPG
ncbi:hypothetical protein JAAARDRAFT_92313, partial [Jaapia argillacea MUCL 33604]